MHYRVGDCTSQSMPKEIYFSSWETELNESDDLTSNVGSYTREFS